MTTTAAPAAAELQPAPDQTSTGFLASILLLMFAMNMLGRGVTETFAVFLLPVQNGLGASRADMTATYSIYMLVTGLVSPFAGQLVDRLGVRVSYMTGLVSLGCGYILAGSSTAVWHYYLTVGVLGGIGTATLGMVVASSIMGRWFDQGAGAKKLGTIVSLPYAAVGAGMLVMPPATQLLLERMSWQSAHKMLGIVVLSLLPLLFVLPLNRVSAGSFTWQERRKKAKAAGAPAWTLRQAVGTSAFWGLAVAYFATSLAAYSVLPQSVAYLINQGFTPLFAASAFGMTGALSTFGIIGIAALSDRIGRPQAATLSYISSMLGISALLMTAFYPTALLVYGYVLFFGLMQGVRGPLILATITALYQGGAVGTIFGTLMLPAGLGAATGAYVAGLLYDFTGGYSASLLLAIGGCAVGMSAFWVVPSLRHQRLDARSG